MAQAILSPSRQNFGDDDGLSRLAWDCWQWLLDIMDMIFDESRAIWHLSYWLFVATSFAIKCYWIQPKLEAHCKKTFAKRELARRKRLQATLQDPVLRQAITARIKKACQGDMEQVRQSLQRMEERASQPVVDDKCDSEGGLLSTKGEEKVEAAKHILMGTTYVSIALILYHSFFYSSVVEVISLSDHGYGYEKSHDLSNRLPVGEYVFCLLHLAHSYRSWGQKTSRKITPKRSNITKEEPV